MKYWYAIYTLPNQEFIAKLNLKRQNYFRQIQREKNAGVSLVDVQTGKGIKIDDEYRFSLVHTDGESISTHKAGASAGQNQIIASAFIAALNKLSAREASIVIDTPLGRLDDLHSTNMIKYYPKFKPQVIILYQPKELGSKDSQDAIQEITPYIHSEYEITADPLDENISTIERIK